MIQLRDRYMERQSHLAGNSGYYPSIFPHEKGQRVESSSEGTELGRSEQTNTYMGGTLGSGITARYTYYDYNVSAAIEEPYSSLLLATAEVAPSRQGALLGLLALRKLRYSLGRIRRVVREERRTTCIGYTNFH